MVVDVTVLDGHGQPVKGLTREDFTVLEDGKPQVVKNFDRHGGVADEVTKANEPNSTSQAANRSQALPTTADAGPLNVVLLDALNTQTSDQVRARQQMIELLKTLPPGKKVAIFTLTNRLKELQNFTSDRDALMAAVNKVLISRSNLSSEDKQDEQQEIAEMSRAGVRADMIANMRQFMEENESNRTDIRVQITMQALRAVAQAVKGYPGRKNLLWVSGTFPFSIQPNTDLRDPNGVLRDYSAALKDTAAALSAAQVAIFAIDPVGLGSQAPDSSYSGTLLSSRYGYGTESLSRQMRNTALDSHATMEQMAQDTGGHAFYNRNDLKLAMQRSIDLGSTYYTLAYTPSNGDYDGKLRHIAVKVDRKDAHLAYRREYYALREGTGISEADKERDLMVALNPESPALTGIHLKASLSTPDAQGRTKVRYTIVPGQLGMDEKNSAAVDLMFVAVGWNNKGEDLGHSMMNLRVPQQKEMLQKLESQPLVVDQEVTVKPEVTYFRVGVLDRLSGQMATLQANMPPAYIAAHRTQ